MTLNCVSPILRKPAFAGFLVVCFTMIPAKNLIAQDGWYVSSSVQIAGGSFVYNSYDNFVSLYGGLGYQDGNLGIALSIPVVGNRNNAISQAGGMMLPIGNPSNTNVGMTGGSNGGGMMGGGNPMVTTGSVGGMNVGFGDLYLSSSYKLFSESRFLSDVIVNGQIKFPTASTHMGIGTGQYDYGASVTLKKSVNTFVAIADLGYLNIGDPSGFTYKNPFTYSLGLGKYFSDGEYSLLLYYSAYTDVVQGYEPPRQIALGINYRASENVILTGIGAAGLSKFSPDYTFSAGIKLEL